MPARRSLRAKMKNLSTGNTLLPSCERIPAGCKIRQTMDPIERCRLCGLNLNSTLPDAQKGVYRLACRRCGEYEITNQAFHDIQGQPAFLRAAARQSFDMGAPLRISNANWEQLVSQHASTSVLENLEKLLNFMLRRCRRPGNSAALDTNLDYTVIDAEHSGEFGWHLQNAESSGYIAKSGVHYSLTAKGWDHLLGPAGTGTVPGRCFVAVSFAEEHHKIYLDGISPAVTDAGHDSIWMKDVLTNEDICFRMIGEIRKAQFLVADFTGLKAGVYFEAGFALALGRQVF